MDGLLLVDKPVGPTSHRVVQRMRRVLGERRIGHTGTLDPAATGLLPLVLGRATRLARFLSASDKTYIATLRLGVSTATGDAEGEPVGPPYTGALPSRESIERALNGFRGTHRQHPPAFSAKRVGGERSYKLARRALMNGDTTFDRMRAAAVEVTAHTIEIRACEGSLVTVLVDCSTGFYIRSLAHDLGEQLGTGAHVATLRRTRAAGFDVAEAIDFAEAEQHPDRAAAAIVPMARILRDWSAAILTPEGVRRVLNGRDLGPADFAAAVPRAEAASALVQLVDVTGDLIAVGEPSSTPGLLHPSVVLR